MCTLGSEADAQRIDSIRGDVSTPDTSADEDSSGTSLSYERFYLQYFFPPSSVGECGRVGPAGGCCVNLCVDRSIACGLQQHSTGTRRKVCLIVQKRALQGPPTFQSVNRRGIHGCTQPRLQPAQGMFSRRRQAWIQLQSCVELRRSQGAGPWRASTESPGARSTPAGVCRCLFFLGGMLHGEL